MFWWSGSWASEIIRRGDDWHHGERDWHKKRSGKPRQNETRRKKFEVWFGCFAFRS